MTPQQQPYLPAIKMRLLKGIPALFALPILLALTCNVVARAATLEGTAAYRERIALPPDAVFEAVLQDIPGADAQPQVLGRTIVDPAGQSPFHFQIGYDEAAVQPDTHYTVTATIKRGGRLLFTTRQRRLVFTCVEAPLQIMLVSAADLKPPAFFARLPASYEHEVPGANSLIRWHLDLLPRGEYQLRRTYLDKPASNQFDQIGRWQYDSKRGTLRLDV